jgi:hypothetical protein
VIRRRTGSAIWVYGDREVAKVCFLRSCNNFSQHISTAPSTAFGLPSMSCLRIAFWVSSNVTRPRMSAIVKASAPESAGRVPIVYLNVLELGISDARFLTGRGQGFFTSVRFTATLLFVVREQVGSRFQLIVLVQSACKNKLTNV